MTALDQETARQIDELALDDRPLIVCDVDEVVLQFVAAFEAFIEDRGHYLDAQSFALTGNVRRSGDHAAATPEVVRSLLDAFFATQMHAPRPVDGAVPTLEALCESAQIVLLTNIPHEARATRIACLDGHGVCHPVIANAGAKGPAVHKLSQRAGRPIFFLDDSPANIRSVAQHVPDAYLIHFVGDARFAALCEPVEEAHFATSDWREARAFIEQRLERAEAQV